MVVQGLNVRGIGLIGGGEDPMVAAVSLTLSLRPTWPTLGIVGAIVVVTLVSARIPRGAVPRIPAWILMVLLAGGLVSIVGALNRVGCGFEISILSKFGSPATLDWTVWI